MRAACRPRRSADPRARVTKPSGGPSSGSSARARPCRRGFGCGGDRLRIRRLEAEAAGHVDRAEQHLQEVERAAGLEAVGMGARCRAWHASPPAGRSSSSCRRPASRSRADVSSIVCSKATCGELGGDARGSCRRECRSARATASGAVFSDRDSARRAAGTRHGAAAVGERVARRSAPARCRGRDRRARPVGHRASQHQRLAVGVAQRTGRHRRAPGVLRSPAMAHWCSARDSRGRSCRPCSSSWISAHDEQPVGAGPDADPVVGDRGVAGAHRIDRDDLARRAP